MKNQLNHGQAEMNDPMLESALRDFRASVHAWSDSAYHGARPAVAAARQRMAWQRVVAWVLSLVLSFGILGTAGYERHHQNVLARQREQQREQERQRVLAEERARETEDLLANVDSDVSREVPAAMEPLAQLMDEQ
jgi:hypothetical protein